MVSLFAISLRILSIGEDCAGLGTGYKALRELIPGVVPLFASETNVQLADRLRSEGFQTVNDDVVERDASAVGRCSMYVAGFTCLPYTRMGKQKGTNDSRCVLKRGVVKYILAQSPPMFVLENVVSLWTTKKFRAVILKIIRELCSKGYYIRAGILNARHFAQGRLPQS